MPWQFAIQSRFSPADDCASALVALVTGAAVRVRVMIYAYTLVPLTDALLAAHARGVDVRGIFDLSQSKSKAQLAQLTRLRAAGIPCVVGTTPKTHGIIHEKGLAVDGRWTATGSYNFSTNAASQVNHLDVFDAPDRAAWFESVWDALWAAVLVEEPLYRGLPQGPAS